MANSWRRWFSTALHFLRAPTFTPRVEALYRTRRNERALLGTRITLLAAPGLFLLFGVWDWWFDVTALPRTVPVRLLFGLWWLVLWLSTFGSFFRQRLAWALALAVISSFIAITWVLNLVPNGVLYGLAGLAYPQFVASCLPSSRFAAFNSIMLLVVFNAAALLFHTPDRVTLNGDFIFFPLCGLMYLCAHANEVRDRRLFALELELEGQARTDGLSGVSNRAHFLHCAQSELERARRYTRPTTLILIDIDHFKRINDTHGHHSGDQAIRWLADTCRGTLRSVDVLARIGGEEFAILLPETDLEPALFVAERLRERVNCGQLPMGEKHQALSFTVSLGVALFQAQDTIDVLMQRADTALYQAKQRGRNQVAVSDPKTCAFPVGSD